LIHRAETCYAPFEKHLKRLDSFRYNHETRGPGSRLFVFSDGSTQRCQTHSVVTGHNDTLSNNTLMILAFARSFAKRCWVAGDDMLLSAPKEEIERQIAKFGFRLKNIERYDKEISFKGYTYSRGTDTVAPKYLEKWWASLYHTSATPEQLTTILASYRLVCSNEVFTPFMFFAREMKIELNLDDAVVPLEIQYESFNVLFQSENSTQTSMEEEKKSFSIENKDGENKNEAKHEKSHQGRRRRNGQKRGSNDGSGGRDSVQQDPVLYAERPPDDKSKETPKN